jgi:uncharacterized membrane protein YfcA
VLHAVVGAVVAIAISALLDHHTDLPMLLRWLLAGLGAAVAGYLLARRSPADARERPPAGA